MSARTSATEIVTELTALHEFKDSKYQDAWRKRGELIGIFANVARKYDRLEIAQSEFNPDQAEPRADTAADLCVYSIKYITWLIEHDPVAADAIVAADTEHWSGVHGHAAVANALTQLALEQPQPPASLSEAFAMVAGPFHSLEEILVSQKDASNSTKARLAWRLASASLAYLHRLALDEPGAWRKFIDYVAEPA
jgi:hypothetical protein